LALAILLCLPLAAQIVGPQFVVPVWDRVNLRYDYAYLPDGWTVTKATIGPSWAYQLVAAPGTNPGQAVELRAADLLDCKPSIAGSVAIIKGPCRVNIGGEIVSITTDATAILSGTVSSGTVRWYWDADGYLRADGGGTSATLTCNAACRVASTTGPGPRVGLPVAEMTFAANVFTVVRDQRAIYGLKVVQCGAGTTCVERQGVTEISVP